MLQGSTILFECDPFCFFRIFYLVDFIIFESLFRLPLRISITFSILLITLHIHCSFLWIPYLQVFKFFVNIKHVYKHRLSTSVFTILYYPLKKFTRHIHCPVYVCAKLFVLYVYGKKDAKNFSFFN